MVKMDVIKPISEPTPAVSPMLIVRKNGKIRICIDPVELNKNIRRRHYPMKTFEHVAANMKDAKYFTKLDCRSGFWQIKVTKRTSKYLTFATPWGRYCCLRMPFGISPAPEIFCEHIAGVLNGLEGVEEAMDDFIIHAKTLQPLKDRTEKVIRAIHAAGLTLNLEKCEFEKTTIKFLGHIFTQNGLMPDPDKIDAIKNLEVPTEKKRLQRILGMVTYLNKFIPNLSTITDPLPDRHKKGSRNRQTVLHIP